MLGMPGNERDLSQDWKLLMLAFGVMIAANFATEGLKAAGRERRKRREKPWYKKILRRK